MTAPVQEQFDPQNQLHWINVLHHATQVPKDSPDYGEARNVVGLALRHIHALHVQSANDEANQQPGSVAALAGGLLHGASLGTGEVFNGLSSAIQGKGFRQGAQDYREGLGELEAAHPTLTPTAEIGGSLALPAGVVGSSLKAVKAGVPLGLRGALGIVGRGAVAGAVPGAVAGFSQGGEDPGDFASRFKSAGTGAAAGGALGAITSGAGIPRMRAHVERTADIANKGVMRELNAQRLRNAQSVGQRYAKKPALAEHVAGDALSDIDQALADFRGGKISQDDLNTALQMAGDGPRAQQLPVRGTVAASAPPKPPVDLTPTPQAPPDPLDTPAFQRRGSPQQDAEVMQRALQRNSYSTRQMPGSKPAPGARAQQASRAAQQIANLSIEELQAAKSMTGGNRQLLSLINRELKRRAGQ